MTDESANDWLRGPAPGSNVPAAPPPWQPPASKDRVRFWAEVCRREVDDAIAAKTAESETAE